MPVLSPFQRHKAKWGRCTACSLCERRRSVVLCRGHLPADILFIGEAPGESEDALGRPFIGPAGKLLDSIIDNAMPPSIQPTWRTCFTNLVACIPRGEDGTKTSEPEKEAILACAPRLQELYKMCQPRLIVCVGALSAKWLDKALPHRDAPSITISHPAAILRANVAQKGLMVQKATVTLADAISDL